MMTVQFHSIISRLRRSLTGAGLWLLLTLALLLSPSLGFAQSAAPFCGEIGPVQFDYRTATPEQRHRVESAHFTPEVETLIRGSSGYLDADINYTLIASPNHARALLALMRLAQRTKLDKLPNMKYPVECYFERGMRFKSDDHIVRMLYVQYLSGRGRNADALAQLEIVTKMVEGNPFALYNVGLLYFDLKDYAQARLYAHKAEEQGFTRPELQEQLEKIGQWQPPQAASASQPAASTSPP